MSLYSDDYKKLLQSIKYIFLYINTNTIYVFRLLPLRGLFEAGSGVHKCTLRKHVYSLGRVREQTLTEVT